MPNTILTSAKAIYDELIFWRREIHRMAETGFDLENTKAFIKSELLKMGIEATDVGRCGLSAVIGSEKEVFLLRADMDALPIAEESSLPFAAEGGNMHSCGHDMHSAMLLGAAKLLKEREESLPFSVKLMFQPAEETLEGADDMIRAGILKFPKPTVAMMIHIAVTNEIRENTVVVSSGITAPSADFFEITVKGKGCHGSQPHLGIDPITAAADIITSLGVLRSRELSPFSPSLLTIGRIETDGASNVIPNSVSLYGTIRSYDEEEREFIKRRLFEIADNTAKALRCSADLNFFSSCPPLRNDEGVALAVYENLKSVLGEESVILSKEKGTGSEDFSYIAQRVPSVMVALTMKGEYPLHHPKAVFDESVLPLGAAVFAVSALGVPEKIRGV